MDLGSDTDLDQDCCPMRNEQDHLPQLHNFHSGKEDLLKEDRFDSRFSSGYQSGNLGSEINEDRCIDDDRLIPVAGLESLTLDNDENKSSEESIDDGFKSSDLILDSPLSARAKSTPKTGDKEEERLLQFRVLLKETYQQDDDGDT